MIRGYVFGASQTVARFGRLNAAARNAIRASIPRLTLKLLARVKSSKLSGQVLNVKTGRLRRSITQRVVSTPTSVSGIVGTNVRYARVHEFGGAVTIKAHLRMQRLAWGRKMRQPHQVNVRAHVVNYPERSFLRSALREMTPEIRAELRNALRGLR